MDKCKYITISGNILSDKRLNSTDKLVYGIIESACRMYDSCCTMSNDTIAKILNRDSGTPPEDAMLIIAKNKFGKTAKIELNFDGKYQNFTESNKINFQPYEIPPLPETCEIPFPPEIHELDN